MKSTTTNDSIFRWVHISDLHIGHSDYVEEAMRDELPKKLSALTGSHPMDALFITGDLVFAPTYKNDTEEIRDKEIIRQTIREIQRSMGWEDDNTAADRTYIVPGNHDVVRDSTRSLVLKNFAPKYNSDKGEISEDAKTQMRNGERRFSNLYKYILGREFTGDHHVEQGEKETRIICLNTTQLCEVTEKNDAAGKEERIIKDSQFILGTKDIKKCFHGARGSKLAIALGHHPVDSFTEAERNVLIREMKNAGVVLYLCGHTHLAEICNVGSEDIPIWQACCGTNMEKLENGNPADMKIFTGEYNISEKQGFIKAYTYSVSENLGDLGWHEDMELRFPKTDMDQALRINTFFFPPEKANLFHVIWESYQGLMKKYSAMQNDVMIRQRLEMAETMQSDASSASRFVVVSETGCGKTHLLQRIVRKYVSEEGETADWQPILKIGESKIPLWISCKRFNRQQPRTDYDPVDDIITQMKLKNKYSYPYSDTFREWIRYLIRQGKLILLVDGLDEITKDENKLTFIRALNSYVQENDGIGIIITTKPYILENSRISEALECYNVCRLLPFEKEDITDYCRKWYRENKDEAAAETDEEAENISQEILGNSSVFSLAKIPLFLDTMLRLNNMNNILPSNQNMLYRELIYALLKKSPHIEKDICLLSAIAFKMSEQGTYQIRTHALKKMIADIRKECSWIFTAQEEAETSDRFLARINQTEQIFRNRSGVWEFYHRAFQNYLVATALVKGFYPELKENIVGEKLAGSALAIPAVDRLFEMSLNPDKEEIVILAAEQLDVFESSVLLYRLTEKAEQDADGIQGSILRNLLLRMLMGGAYATREQRSQIYKVVQSHNLSDLQADTFYQMWSSEYAEEFKETCTEYLNEMFRMIRDSENPIQDILDEIQEIQDGGDGYCAEHDSELEKSLYVLDGILWGYRLRYVRLLEGTDDHEKLEKVMRPVAEIISIGAEDLACVRRACGVMQRIVDIGGEDYLEAGILKRLFRIYGTEIAENSELADNYSGIRIFGTIPLKPPFMEILTGMDLCVEKRYFLKELYTNANNTQDKIAAFWAAALGKGWTYDEAMLCIQSDFTEFPESEAVRMKESIERLKVEGFYDAGQEGGSL